MAPQEWSESHPLIATPNVFTGVQTARVNTQEWPESVPIIAKPYVLLAFKQPERTRRNGLNHSQSLENLMFHQQISTQSDPAGMV